PFAGVNGSGKHNNWSLITDTGVNLFAPSSSARDNLMFLTFFVTTIKGVHEYSDLLRASIASYNNDFRLGANEAPPAIISVYLGSQLEDVFQQIRDGQLSGSAIGGMMDFGIDTLPEFPRDAGDRNRTSPFAFTGNRFEFRAVGSGQSVAGPLVVLNTILADSIGWIADALETKLSQGEGLESASLSVLQSVMQQHGQVVFGGNGYSEEWHRMAVEERGLENLRTTADALPVLERPGIRELFERTGVLTPIELQSRFEVYAEQYILAIDVEAKLVVQIARTQVYPAAMRYVGELSEILQRQSALGLPTSTDLCGHVSSLCQSLLEASASLEEGIAHPPHGTGAHLRHAADVLVPRMNRVREVVDGLEALVDDDVWPLSSYQEMLFV
ncbi:MAG: glutamine synthetase type III, partial [Cyanobium sp.]